jgi:gliding motility-associated-like protein
MCNLNNMTKKNTYSSHLSFKVNFNKLYSKMNLLKHRALAFVLIAIVFINNDVFSQCTLKAVAPDIKACYGDSPDIKLSVTNGSGNYTYLWDTPDGYLSNTGIQEPMALSVYKTTMFYVTVTDNTSGCVAKDTMFVIINKIVADAGFDMDDVCSNTDTVLTGKYTGGFGRPVDFVFQWFPEDGIADKTKLQTKFNWSNTGSVPFVYTYTFTAIDSLGCSHSEQIDITINPKINFSNFDDKIICPGGSTQLTGTVSGGTGALNPVWAPNQNITNNKILNPVVNPSTTTKYILTITDAKGCKDTTEVNIALSSPMTSNMISDTICKNSSTTLNFSFAGGTAPHRFLWLPAGLLTNSTLQNPTTIPLAATTKFILTITDNIGCQKKDSLIITINDPVPSLPDTVKICNNTSTAIAPLVTGGNGQFKKYLHTWSPATGIAVPTADTAQIKLTNSTAALISSNYQYSVKDSLGCSANEYFVVSIYPAIVFTPAPFAPKTICQFDSVKIGGNVSGGIGNTNNFVYKWTPSSSLQKADTLTTFAKPTGNTSYKLVVTDLVGCKDSVNQAVNLHPIIFPEAGKTALICRKGNYTMQASATGGTGALSYTWTPSSSLSKTNILNPDVTKLGASTTYFLQVKDALGCKATDAVTINVSYPEINPIPELNSCRDVDLKFRATGIKGFPPYKYAWSGLTIPNNAVGTKGLEQKDIEDSISSPTFLKANPVGVYIYNVVVKDVMGCISDKYVAQATVWPLPVFKPGKLVKHCFETEPAVEITADSGFVAYSWLSNSSTLQTYSTSSPGYFVYSATDKAGCQAKDSIKVVAVCPPRVYVPEAFSPNGDGLNDRLRIFGEYYRDAYMKIFNRWGEVIYFQNKETGEWDGNVKGVPVAPGVYTYEIHYKDMFSEIYQVSVGKFVVVK